LRSDLRRCLLSAHALFKFSILLVSIFSP